MEHKAAGRKSFLVRRLPSPGSAITFVTGLVIGVLALLANSATIMDSRFIAGQRYAETQTAIQLVQVERTITELRASFNLVKAANKSLLTEKQQLQDVLAQEKVENDKLNAQNTNLSAQADDVDICAPIRQQVDRLSKELEKPPGTLVFSRNSSVQASLKKDKAEETALERTYQDVTQQLIDCYT